MRPAIASLLRAARTTVVIIAVAVLFISIRDGQFRIAAIKAFLAENLGTWLVVFLAAGAWDNWFDRPRRTPPSK
jgi:hypothetical protein